MQVQPFSALMPPQRAELAFDDWSHRLHGICGQYQPHRHDRSNSVTGHVRCLDAGGIEVAHIGGNLAHVRREQADIRRDYGENLFLLIQLEGSCGIEQTGRQAILSPGDCVLIDSARPSLFHFNGRFSNHISVHLPRQILFARAQDRLEVSRRITAGDPMATMLSALVAKLLATGGADRRAAPLRQLLFDATRQAFATDEEVALLPRSDSTLERLEIVQVLIDRHLTDEHLTPRWLADRLGISLRTLQEDFSEIGTTATSLIRLRRLHLAREELIQRRDAGARTNIAEVAYATGFNDISYFNRCFRQAFACTPKDVLGGEG